MGQSVAHTREWVRAVVRSGMLSAEQLLTQVHAALQADHPDLATQAQDWIDRETEAWAAEAATWPEVTGFDRFQQACAELTGLGLVVLQGIADHWVVKERLGSGASRGAAWFTRADIWHAVDEPMLEVNLWHASGANAAPGDELLDEALAVFEGMDLEAHFDEGRIEVAVLWQPRPSAD